MELLATATTIMALASTASRPVRPWGRATSMTARIRNGLTSEISDDAPTRNATNSRLHRYGRNSATIRRSGTRGLPVLAAGDAATGGVLAVLNKALLGIKSVL